MAKETTNYTATYLDVNASDIVSAIYDSLSIKVNSPAPSIFIIHSGKLYLLVQVVWNCKGEIRISREFWDAKKIHNFITDRHAHFKSYLPDPKKPCGGILWIDCSEYR